MNRLPRHPLVVTAVAFSLVCVLYAVGIHLWPVGADYAETNSQSNQIRLSVWLYGPPVPAVLVGTSLSGRLLPEYFAGEGLAVANLGLDGCTPRTGLALVRQRSTPPAVVLLEASPPREARGNDREVLEMVRGPVFRLARWLPFLRPEHRPSSVLYSQLKKWRDSSGPPAGADRRRTNPPSAPARPGSPTAEPDLAPMIRAAREDLRRAVRDLQAQGTRVVLIRLPLGPAAAGRPGIEADFAEELRVSEGCPIIDVAERLATAGVTMSYTDGLHPGRESCLAAIHSIAEWLEDNPSARP
ncbi:hypothetical protein HQ590_06585 [bacterium]|nr:hypothetical protein [bacterium]